MTSPLDKGSFIKTLQSGKTTYGIFTGLAAPLAAEVAAASGVDWVLVDLEHGAGGEEQVSPTVVATGAYGVPTLVRIEAAERIRIGRVLDAGVAGVMVPRLESATQAEQVVRHFSYPPLGDRGVASYNRAARWGLEPDALLPIKTAATIIQIETLGALAEVNEIAHLEGVDLLFVGPLDLSYALGVPRQFDHPSFIAALKSVLAASKNAGKPAGILAANATAAKRFTDMGFSFIALSSDSVLLSQAIIENLERAKN